MDKKKKIIIGACGAICVLGIGAGILWNLGRGEKKGEDLVYVMSVGSMNSVAGTQRLAGVVESQKTLDIQKDPEREIKEVLVKAGDEVDVGTALFVYDTASLETDLQQAKLDLERADNSMGNLREQIAQLQKEKKRASEDEQFSYTTQIQTAEMDLKKTEYEKKGKEVEINRIQEKINHSTVNSEMKGVVKSISSGESGDSMYGGQSQAFITILATGAYRVKGKVNEQNMGEVIEGEKAVIRSRVKEEETWTGIYSAIDTKNPNASGDAMMYGGAASDSAETTSTSYPFYVELDSSEGLLLGQHVYIERDTGAGQREEGIWLDEAFLEDVQENPYVWAESGKGTLEKRSVTLGAYDEEMFQYKIEKGLEAGDYVAYPQEDFKEGKKTTHELQDLNLDGIGGAETEEEPLEENPEEQPGEGEVQEDLLESGEALQDGVSLLEKPGTSLGAVPEILGI